MGVLTANERTLKCHGYGKIKLGLKQVQPRIVEVLVVVGFYGISTFVGYLMLNPFLCK